MYLLRDRSDDLAAAGIRAFGISRDSPWSHRAWKETLGVDVPLLSDWNGEATRAFDVAFEALGMTDVPMRAAFLIRDGKTIEATWMLGAEMPDIDAIIADGGESLERRLSWSLVSAGIYGTTTSFVPAPSA